MKSSRFILLVFLLASASAAQAQSVFKCTNPDGSISFQDRACPDSAEEKRVVVNSSRKASDYEVKVVTLAGVGEAAVMVYDYMEIARREVDEQTTRVRVRSKSGAHDRMGLVMTFTPNTTGVVPSREDQEAMVKALGRQYRGLSTKPGPIQEIQPRSGSALISVLTDAKPSGGFSSGAGFLTTTVGRVVDQNVIVDIAIHSDGVRNKAFTDALSIVQSFGVAGDVIAADAKTGALKLPEAPTGFSWVQAPEIKAVLLKPDGWHFETENQGGDYEYHLSLEPNIPPNGFDTGLTVSVETNIPARKGKLPSEHAQAFVQEFTNSFEVVGEPFSAGRGPYTSHGALVSVKDPVKGEFNAHIVAIANDSTGTVYLCVFEGPAARWDEIWPMGELMLQKMAINDGI